MFSLKLNASVILNKKYLGNEPFCSWSSWRNWYEYYLNYYYIFEAEGNILLILLCTWRRKCSSRVQPHCTTLEQQLCILRQLSSFRTDQSRSIDRDSGLTSVMLFVIFHSFSVCKYVSVLKVSCRLWWKVYWFLVNDSATFILLMNVVSRGLDCEL